MRGVCANIIYIYIYIIYNEIELYSRFKLNKNFFSLFYHNNNNMSVMGL